ncbi:sugar transferase [Derxia lacustris]|uniref:sugar transferase n=1 Tax=Derxia lacustris TaxID=764842 RepID=UPI001C38D1F0|nr:sugar transferase [Derxia lacustris]
MTAVLASSVSRFRLSAPPKSGPDAFAQAMLHRIAAALIFICISPIFLLLTVLMAFEKGPIFFGHFRVGRDGRMFRCLKFRTMVPDAERVLQELLARDPAAREEWARDQKLMNDPRITRIGQFLRKTSLDELPQLVNVIVGDMALVGPRPVTAQELHRYGRARFHYLSVTPGITGLWQVSGRNNTTYEERVELDKHYVENCGVWFDLKILLRTAVVLVTGDGAR